jgi:hypothetical protein
MPNVRTVYRALPGTCVLVNGKIVYESRWAGLTVDRGLTGELLQHLGSTGQSVTRLADRDVQDELLDAELPHGVLGLLRLIIVLVCVVE